MPFGTATYFEWSHTSTTIPTRARARFFGRVTQPIRPAPPRPPPHKLTPDAQPPSPNPQFIPRPAPNPESPAPRSDAPSEPAARLWESPWRPSPRRLPQARVHRTSHTAHPPACQRSNAVSPFEFRIPLHQTRKLRAAPRHNKQHHPDHKGAK